MLENLQYGDLEKTPQKRGERLRKARKMTKLSRQDIQDKYGIKAGSIRSWEAGWKSGLSEKGARSMIVALMKEGIQCSIGWLLYGTGSEPRRIHQEKKDEASISNGVEINQSHFEVGRCAQHLMIREELATYEKNHTDAATLIIQDDGMEPNFSIGDYVAGSRRYGNHIESLIGLFCIVETQMGEVLARQIHRGITPGFYNLGCINVQTTVKKPYLYDVELISAAPIVWHRKKDILDV